jgi:hypothetical protein
MSNGTSSLWSSRASSYPWRSNDAQPMQHNQMQHRMMRPGSRKPPHAQPCLLGMGLRGPLLLERATWRAPLALTRNCTRDEGRLFEVGNQVLISSYRKLVRQSHACNPHGAIIALQHPDTSLVWVGSKARITAPQHYCPLHPNYPTLVVHHWHFAFVPILLQTS